MVLSVTISVLLTEVSSCCFVFGGGSFVGYPMWKLKSPLCPLLTKLRKLNTEVTNVTKITLSLGEFSTVNSKLAGDCSAPVVSTLKWGLVLQEK